MSYDTWQERLAGLVRVHDLLNAELGDISKRASANGFPDSSGIAGVRGRLTHVSETLDRVLTDAFITQDGGWNTFQGHLSDILLPSRLDVEGVAILMAYYDSRTLHRLHDALCGGVGSTGTVGAECSRMIVSVEPRTT